MKNQVNLTTLLKETRVDGDKWHLCKNFDTRITCHYADMNAVIKISQFCTCFEKAKNRYLNFLNILSFVIIDIIMDIIM